MQIKNLCAVIFLFLLVGCSKTQLYYVKDAKMIPFPEVPVGENTFVGNRSGSPKFLLNGHYVTSGNNLVFLIRKFDIGSFFTIDDESYEKLTIEIKNLYSRRSHPIRFP